MVKLSKFIKQLKNEKKIIRMIVVGDGAVGKTTLVRSMLLKTKRESKSSSYIDKIEDKKVTRTHFMEIESWDYNGLVIQCYDLAGQRTPGLHPLDIISNQVLSYIDIYIFVFSLNRYDSFENIGNWMKLMNIEDKNENNAPGFILVGNKLDLERNISKELIETIMKENNHFQKYVETCAITGLGVKKLLNEILKMGKNLLNSNI